MAPSGCESIIVGSVFMVPERWYVLNADMKTGWLTRGDEVFTVINRHYEDAHNMFVYDCITQNARCILKFHRSTTPLGKVQMLAW